MKICGKYKDKIKVWQKNDAGAKTWDIFKTFLSDIYFKLKQDNQIGTKRQCDLQKK